MNLGFHLFVSEGDPGNEDFVCKRVGSKIFLRDTKDKKALLRFSASC